MSDELKANRMQSLRVMVTVDTDVLREWAGKHSDAGHAGVAHVLYESADRYERTEDAATLTESVQALSPHIDIDVTWDEKRWRPVDPEGPGVAIAWSITWFEDNPLHDGPEPCGDEGPLETLLPRLTEILGYPALIPGAGIHVDISGWALHYLPVDPK